MPKERLQKVLAGAGVGSRRKCEELILSGVVRVNGAVVESLPAFVDAERDVVSVDGRRVRAERKVYFLLNKPKGVICTSGDAGGRRRAIDIVASGERIFCVGRLDVDTSGTIVLTNDSELANLLAHPRYGLSKTYVVGVRGRVSGETVEKLKKGIWLSEGKTRRSSVKILKRRHTESLLEITIRQGLNRQVRRMLAKVGHKVVSLKRTQIGKLSVRGLGTGKYRRLSESEIAYLRKATAVSGDK
ncbi:MAG: pseudouridine synthase [Planctomycetota bacterium]|jgi:pseudouridine synthase